MSLAKCVSTSLKEQLKYKCTSKEPDLRVMCIQESCLKIAKVRSFAKHGHFFIILSHKVV